MEVSSWALVSRTFVMVVKPLRMDASRAFSLWVYSVVRSIASV